MNHVVRVEATPWTALAYCDCGWRQIFITAEDADESIRRHEQEVHPEDATSKYRSRRQRERAGVKKRKRGARLRYGW